MADENNKPDPSTVTTGPYDTSYYTTGQEDTRGEPGQPKPESAAEVKKKAKETEAEKKAKEKAKAEAEAKKKKEAQEKQIKADEAAIDNGPWAKLSEGLVKQYQAAQAPVEQAVSGTGINQAEAGAANQALASLGLSPDSSAAQWLESNVKSAQATAAPAQAAMAQYGQQYQAQEKPISNALTAYGQANQLAIETAPEQAWLNAAASHVTSNLSYQGEIPTSDLKTLPPAVLTGLQQTGGYPGTTGSGLTPISSLGVKDGKVVSESANAASQAAGAASGGSVPTASNSSAAG